MNGMQRMSSVNTMDTTHPASAPGRRKVLIVEDDEAMVIGLKDGFEFEGYAVTVATDGITGIRLARELRPDLLLLDVMLPKLSGLDLCKRIRAEGDKVPIIMLTARGQEIDKVLGLKSGADDYVTKPFSFLELMARVDAVLRRAGGSPGAPESFRFGDVEVSFKSGELIRKGKRVEVSPRELRLLQFFIEHRGQVVSREQLLRDVWGHEAGSLTRTVDMHVAKLRKKIEDEPSEPRFLVTVHGAGYRFNG